MKNTETPPTDVGIIVGRFQVDILHAEHKALFDHVVARHDRVLVFIGLSPLRNTDRNPLDFNSRKRMISESYPEIEVFYIDNNRSDSAWSKNLDSMITKWLKPRQTVTLYGSRDSFISHYDGIYPTETLESTDMISGTEVRRRIANKFKPTAEFRAGVISSAASRYPSVHVTVDVALIDRHDRRILLGQKLGEGLRFVGGYASVEAISFEADARRIAMRETKIVPETIEYIGSTLIEDWRYRDEQDKIKTLFYLGTYISGRPEAADDIVAVKWVWLDELFEHPEHVVEEHRILVHMLHEHIKRKEVTP